MKRSAIKKRAPKRRAGHDSNYLAACRDQNCYLRMPGICCNDPSTSVPAHSNQSVHGKGMGLKARDEFTIPACWMCHAELDAGRRFTREERRDIWDKAYARWEVDRGI